MASRKMTESAYIVLFTTTSNSKEAHKIARALLSQRKAACISIVPGISSLFWWQDKLDSAQENLLIVKTKASLLNQIVKLLERSTAMKFLR